MTARRLAVELLEDRVTPVTLYGVTDANVLLTFDSATPGTIADSDTITGLQVGEQIVGIDVRPATGQLYALGLVDDGATRTARIYTLDPITGAATQVGGTPWTTAYPDNEFGGFNFNPNVDLIRVISREGPNFRVSPVTGALVGTDTNTSETGMNGVSYTNNDGFLPTTTLFAMDFDDDELATIGGLNGTPSPNGGQVITVGSTGVTAIDSYAIEITSSGGVATAFATEDGNLHTVNLGTGALTLVGAIGGAPSIRGLTAALPNTITVGGSGGNDTVVVTATNANSGSYTLNGGTPVSFSGIESFSFIGGGGNDTLTINNPAIAVFAPVDGIIFHGGGGNGDALFNLGGIASNGFYVPLNATDGTLVHVDGPDTQTITFTGLSPVTDTVAETFFEINGTAAADTINVVNGPVAGQIQVNSGAVPTFELVNFANKELVTIKTGEGDNTVNLNFTDTTSGMVFLTVLGGSTIDTFNVLSTAVPTNIFAGGGNDSIVFADGATLSGGEPNGEGGTDTLDYTAYTTPVAANLGLGVTGLSAVLDGGQEVTSNGSSATGTAAFSNYSVPNKTFDLTLTVTDLAPADVTGLHLHRGGVGLNGPVILDLLALGTLTPVGTGFTLTLTGVDLSNSLLGGDANEAAFLGGITYVNIHTAAFPNGLIRGQVFSTGNVNLPSGTATGTGGADNFENVIGGSAADSLIGSFAANVLTGNGENDILLGGPGGDTFLGGIGNDIMIWSNGDGSDIMDGEAGDDLVQVNGALAGGALNDTFSVAANGTRIDFDRTSTGPFSLDIGTVETLNVNGIDGTDTFNVSDLTGVTDLGLIRLNGFAGDDTFNINGFAPAGIAMNVVGGLPTTAPGDTLNFDAQGGAAVHNGPSITDGFRTLNHTQLEAVNITNAVNPLTPGPLLVTGPPAGNGLLFTPNASGAYETGVTVALIPGFAGELHTALGDVNGDGILDTVVGTGAGNSRIRVLNGADQSVLADFIAFPGYTGGVFVSVGDLTGDGNADIAVTPDAIDAFSGPVSNQLPVRVFSGASLVGGTANPALVAAFDGLASLNGSSGQGNPDVRLGGRPSIADVNNDGLPDLLIAAGNGGGPRITIWNGTGFAGANGGTPTTNPIANLFVFESTQRGGAFVTAGDVNRDGRAEIIVGGGPGGGPRVRIVNSAILLGLANLEGVNLDDPTNLANGLVLNNFFAGDQNLRGGIRLTVRDVNGDGIADVVTGSGTNEQSSVRVYNGLALEAVFGSSQEPANPQVFDPFNTLIPGGVFVG